MADRAQSEVAARHVAEPSVVRVALLLVVVAAVVYAPALFGQFVYDDEPVIQQNVDLQAGNLGALCTQPFFSDQAGYWRPVTMLVLWLGLQLGGAFGIHALAILVHALAGLAGFLVARRVLGDERTATWAAVLFVVHPVQVENVAWCSAISGPLAGLFSLLAIHAVLVWRRGDAPSDARWPWRMALWLLLALLCKEVALGVVPVLVVCMWVLRDQAGERRAPQFWIALGAISGGWLLLRSFVLHDAAPMAAVAMDLQALGTAAWLLVRQAVLLFWPWPLTPFHAFERLSASQSLLVLCGLAGLSVVLLLPRLRAFLRQVPQHLLVAAALLVLSLLPGAIMHGTVGDYPLAERYAYLSVLGLGLLLAPLAVGARRWFAALVVVVFACMSCNQSIVWRDQRSLVAHGLHHAEADPLLHVMMANLDLAATQRGELAALPRAFDHYAAADRVASQGARPLDRKAQARARLGLAWCEMIRQQRANRVDSVQLIQMFQGALDLSDQDASAWVGLGVANALAGRADVAERSLRKALALDARCTEAWFNLGYLQAEQGRPRDARVSLRQALRCQPDLLPAKQLLERLR